jgi:benzylsuccinate CoA-transferase BbsE subunit
LSETANRDRSILGGYRVLDLTDEKGVFCGWVLASLGADVIKVESPKGDRLRSLAPFYKDKPGIETSLQHFAYNANKKGITLDIETADGQAILKRLVETSHFLVESSQPGRMERLGLGYGELSQINPKLVMTSITPFGQQGPYSQYKATELVCSAMSGFTYLTGDPDRAPLWVSVPQAYTMGGSEGAAATMIAHYHRERTGEGQYIDVSIRESMIKATINAIPWWEHYGKVLKRGGPYWMLRDSPVRVLWPCKDGWVSFSLHGGRFGARTNRELVDWMECEGMGNDFLKNMDWESLDMEDDNREVHEELENAVVQFFATHTRKELHEGALKRGIMFSSVETMEDIAKSKQLSARKYWEEVEHPELETTLTYPGPFIRASETPCARTMRAPLLGEHNEAIYLDDLGMTREQLTTLKASKVI